MPPGKGPKVVTFTDGMVFNVPDDTVVVYKVCGGSQLPVDWLAFKGENIQNQYTHLSWSTVSETGNEYFDIERSVNGVEWIKLGSQQGQINSKTISDYTFNDASPEYGINYYRLKQVDLNGKYSYSKVITVYFGDTHTGISLYPNPATSQFTIKGSDLSDSKIVVKDVLGRICSLNELSSSVMNERVYDSGSLANGIYLVEVINESTGDKLTVKLIKE